MNKKTVTFFLATLLFSSDAFANRTMQEVCIDVGRPIEELRDCYDDIEVEFYDEESVVLTIPNGDYTIQDASDDTGLSFERCEELSESGGGQTGGGP